MHLKVSTRWVSGAAGLLSAVLVACGGDDGGDEGDTTNTANTTQDPTNPGRNENAAADCSGAFASLPSPYGANTAIEEWGGFWADERGLVFSAIPDPLAESYEEDLPTYVFTADPSGNVENIYTVPEAAFIGAIFAKGDDLYFVEGFFDRRVMSMPRAGGSPTALTDDRVWAGPVSDGSKLYYVARPEFTNSVIAVLDPATRVPEVLLERSENEIAAIAYDQGTLFWVEREDALSEADYAIYRMPVAGGTPELIMTVPSDTAIGNFRVAGNAAFGSTLTESFGIEIHRTEFGGAPEVVADDGGLPMLIAGGSIYYGSTSGLKKNSLTFDSPSVVEGSSGKGIAAIAAGPTDLWYAAGRCIYRAPF
jgi:hypothetical protein